jgi:hypothetical protein
MTGNCQQLQKELTILQEELVLRDAHVIDELSFRSVEQERLLFVEALRKWQMAYEELKAIY